MPDRNPTITFFGPSGLLSFCNELVGMCLKTMRKLLTQINAIDSTVLHINYRMQKHTEDKFIL